MTRKEWLNAKEPLAMLEYLRGKASARKLRLFGCAVCRHVWHRFTDERTRRAVEVVERYADGRASFEEMAEAERAASEARDLAVGPCSNAPCRHRSRSGKCTSWAAYALTNVPEGQVVWRDVQESSAYVLDAERGRCRLHRAAGAGLLRDIFGNPFCPPPALDPAWLSEKVKYLAEAAYVERSLPDGTLGPERLSMLADALQAPCSNTFGGRGRTAAAVGNRLAVGQGMRAGHDRTQMGRWKCYRGGMAGVPLHAADAL